MPQGIQNSSNFIYLDGMPPVQQTSIPQNNGMLGNSLMGLVGVVVEADP